MEITIQIPKEIEDQLTPEQWKEVLEKHAKMHGDSVKRYKEAVHRIVSGSKIF